MNYNYLVIILLNSLFLYLFSLQYFEHPEVFKLNPIYPPTVITNVESKCPMIIHQLVPNINNVPTGLYHTILHNIRMNPEFEYRIYDNNSALELLKKDFSVRQESAFISSNSNQLKTDYIKYAFITKYGGIFLDIKYICMYKFIDLLKYNNVYFVQMKRYDDLELAILGSHPNNPGISSAFNTATENLCHKTYTNIPSRITGGTVIRDTLFNYGYLSDYVKLNIDTDHIIRMKHTQDIICKKYASYENENNLFHLLPSITDDFKEGRLYENDYNQLINDTVSNIIDKN